MKIASNANIIKKRSLGIQPLDGREVGSRLGSTRKTILYLYCLRVSSINKLNCVPTWPCVRVASIAVTLGAGLPTLTSVCIIALKDGLARVCGAPITLVDVEFF